MEKCDRENLFLCVSTIITGFLWLLSEIIGSSTCKSGGVIEFMIRGYFVHIRPPPREPFVVLVDEPQVDALLIDE